MSGPTVSYSRVSHSDLKLKKLYLSFQGLWFSNPGAYPTSVNHRSVVWIRDVEQAGNFDPRSLGRNTMSMVVRGICASWVLQCSSTIRNTHVWCWWWNLAQVCSFKCMVDIASKLATYNRESWISIRKLRKANLNSQLDSVVNWDK
jgi:hypothetical protein